jgi:hypothetical protein
MTAVLNTIASFNGADGAYPVVGAIADANGDLYGTTSNGGVDGDGTAFEIVNTGTVAAPQYASTPTTLVSFNGADGADPFGGLIADANGDLYGTTSMYGDPVTFETGAGSAETVFAGSGTAFEIVNTGTVAAPQYASTPTTLVNFVGPSASYPGGNLVPDTTGTYPTGLIADANGDLFGTTLGSMVSGPGTMFEMVNTGTAGAPQYASTPTTLVSFEGTDVASRGVIADANGDLFATTTQGQVLEIANTGTVAAPQYASAVITLASLDSSSSSPSSGLIVDANGDLFGTTIGEVGTSLYATVFEMANIGTVAAPKYASTPTTLASFNGSALPFYQPDGGGGMAPNLIVDAKGDLFGGIWGRAGRLRLGVRDREHRHSFGPAIRQFSHHYCLFQRRPIQRPDRRRQRRSVRRDSYRRGDRYRLGIRDYRQRLCAVWRPRHGRAHHGRPDHHWHCGWTDHDIGSPSDAVFPRDHWRRQ